MNQRLDAAANAFIGAFEHAPWSTAEEWHGELTATLAAADEVMFSEAMHAKVAQVLWESEGCTWQVQASRVFEALKGDA